MNILYFGYGNHARRIRHIVTNSLRSHDSLVEFAIKKHVFESKDEIPTFSCIRDAIKKCGKPDIAFIATPNNLHLDAFRLCLDMNIPYIYVEKPAIGVEDCYLKHLAEDGNPLKYLAVGYHYLKNQAFVELKRIIDTKVYGEILSFNIATGHGLAFKSCYSKSWRAQGRLEVAHTAASHLISLAQYLFEGRSILQSHQHLSSWASPSIPDTYNGYFVYANGATATLMSSWAIPCTKKCSIVFTNGVWEYDFERVSISSPRDTFDEDGLFVRPKSISWPLPFEGISPSITDFLSKALTGSCYSPFFAFSREVSKIVDEI